MAKSSDESFARTRLLLGQDAMQKLQDSRVAVFGVGGVGGYAVEVLARSGVGHLTVIDNDRVDITNLNRQIIALHSTIGQQKVDVIEKRILDINPHCQVSKLAMFYLPSNADAIELSAFEVADVNDTKMDPLAKIIRKKLRKLGIDHLKVVYSEEPPLPYAEDRHFSPSTEASQKQEGQGRRAIPASNAFVPAAAGLVIGGEVVKDLIK